MKLPHRRYFLHLAASATALPVVSRIARADTYPSRPVRIIVAFAAGGTTLLARARRWHAAQLAFTELLYDFRRLRLQDRIGVIPDKLVAVSSTVPARPVRHRAGA